MTNGLKKEDSAALKGLAVLLLIFHHCYRLADRIERYQVGSVRADNRTACCYCGML